MEDRRCHNRAKCSTTPMAYSWVSGTGEVLRSMLEHLERGGIGFDAVAPPRVIEW